MNFNIKKLLIIARYTFIEIYKSKIMINVLILGGVIAVLSYVAAEFTYGVPGRVALDVGLGLMTISSVGIATFIGATLISKEVDQRTIYMTLSRPVTRSTFLMGRLLGLKLILLLNVILLSAFSGGCALLFGAEVGAPFLWTSFFVFLESLLVLLVVTFFSMFTNTIISVLFSLTTYIAGHAVGVTLNYETVKLNNTFSTILRGLDALLPSFGKLNIKKNLLYEQFAANDYLWGTTFYVGIYALALLILISLIFNKKNLD
jgi:ABC-type transport system involved in multi-copper enzyme maturation permease subunit